MRLSLASSAALAAILAISSAPAVAADLPYEEPPAVIAVEGFSWSGFYVGGAVGYAFSDLKVRNSNTLNDTFRYKDSVDSILGSAYVGVNYQFGALVVGAEGDVTFGDFGGKTKSCANGFNCKANADDVFGTVRGRVGYAFDRFLVFGTGGLAIGGDADLRRDAPAGFPIGGVDYSKKSSGTRYGYAVGGGVEYAVTDNIIVRGEYQYVDFGKEKFRLRNDLGSVQPAEIDQDMHIIRAGVAYKF